MDEEHKSIADFYDYQYYVDSKQTSPTKHLRNLGKRLNVHSGHRVLDIACGRGEWLKVCRDRGAQVSGIDISSKAISICQQTLPEGNFQCQPAETLPYQNETFDLVTCLGSLEHFVDQEKAIQEMARVSKPDAKVLILIPNSGFLTYRLGLYSGTHQQAARETIRSLVEWRGMIEHNGLLIDKRWKDLHILSRSWIFRPPLIGVPIRLAQAAMLPLWPLSWQYQVYHLCSVVPGK